MKFGHWLASLSVILTVMVMRGAHGLAADSTVGTGDRLEFAFSSTGALAEVSMDGRELPRNGQGELFPIGICDVTKGAEFVPAAGCPGNNGPPVGDCHGWLRERMHAFASTTGGSPRRSGAKADGVSSHPDAGFSVYVDIYYTDGTPLYGRTINWQTLTTDWQYGEMTIKPAKPIRNVNVYLLLRGHSGTVWFDDLFVTEAPSR